MTATKALNELIDAHEDLAGAEVAYGHQQKKALEYVATEARMTIVRETPLGPRVYVFTRRFGDNPRVEWVVATPAQEAP